MAINDSGIRDIARVLGVSTNTVLSELKKEATIETVNVKLLEQKQEEDASMLVDIVGVEEEVELDEMWSFVGKKSTLAMACDCS